MSIEFLTIQLTELHCHKRYEPDPGTQAEAEKQKGF